MCKMNLPSTNTFSFQTDFLVAGLRGYIELPFHYITDHKLVKLSSLSQNLSDRCHYILYVLTHRAIGLCVCVYLSTYTSALYSQT